MSSEGPHGHGCHPMFDAIAELAFGHTVEFNQPLTDHGRALMNALGVNVVYVKSKAQCEVNGERE